MRKDAWTHEKFWQRFNELPDKDLYTVIELPEKLSAKVKVSFRCNEGHNFATTINNFLNNKTRCFTCKIGVRWNAERFLKELEVLPDKDDYIFSDYENINRWDSKFTVQCKKCSYIWKANPRDFFNSGTRCSFCNIGEKWTIERVIKEFTLLQDSSDFTLILDGTVEIKNSFSKIKIQCHKCSHIWKVRLRNFFNNKNRCPVCRESKGEQIISLFLESNEIIFERQKKFETCRNIHLLPFDFYLPDYQILLEMQGKQHYQIISRSRSEEKNLKEFEQIKIRDEIKKQWAIANSYTFLEIRYDQINQIEEILTQELNL